MTVLVLLMMARPLFASLRSLRQLTDTQLDLVGSSLSTHRLENIFLAASDILGLPEALAPPAQLPDTSDQGTYSPRDAGPSEAIAPDAAVVDAENEYLAAIHEFAEQMLLLSFMDFAKLKGHLTSVAVMLIEEAGISHPFRASTMGFMLDVETFPIAMEKILPYKRRYFDNPSQLALFKALWSSHLNYKHSVQTFRVTRDRALIKPALSKLSAYLHLLLHFCKNTRSPTPRPNDDFDTALDFLLGIENEDIDMFRKALTADFGRFAGVQAEVVTCTVQQRRLLHLLHDLGHIIERFKPFCSDYFLTAKQLHCFNTVYTKLKTLRAMTVEFRLAADRFSFLRPLIGALNEYARSLEDFRGAALEAATQSSRALCFFEVVMEGMSRVTLDEFKDHFRDYAFKIYSKAGMLHLFRGPRGQKCEKITQMNDLLRSVYVDRDRFINDDGEKAALEVAMRDFEELGRSTEVFNASRHQLYRQLTKAAFEYLTSLHAFVRVVAKRLLNEAPVTHVFSGDRRKAEAEPDRYLSNSGAAKKARVDQEAHSLQVIEADSGNSPLKRDDTPDEDLLDMSLPVMTEEQIDQLAALLETPED